MTSFSPLYLHILFQCFSCGNLHQNHMVGWRWGMWSTDYTASPPVSWPRKPGWKPNTCILNKLWNEWCSLSWDHNLWTTHLLSRPKAFFFFFFFFFFCKMALAGPSSLTLFKTIFLDCIVTVLISPCIKNIYISKLVNFCVAILVSKMQEKTAFFSIVCFIISRKVKKATEMQKKKKKICAVYGEGAMTDLTYQK